MIGSLAQAVARDHTPLQFLSFLRCMRSWQISWTKCKTPPLGGIICVSPPKPVGPQQLSLLRPTVLRAKLPLPCMPWLSCKSTKPRHKTKCTRGGPTWVWYSLMLRTVTDFTLQVTKVKVISMLVAQECHSGRDERRRQTVLPWRSHLPAWAIRRHCRGISPAVLGSTKADWGYPAHHASCLSLPIDEGMLLWPSELLRPVPRPHRGQRVEPHVGARCPLCLSQPLSSPGRRWSSPDTDGPGTWGTALLTQVSFFFPRSRAGGRILGFFLFLFRRWPKDQQYTHSQRKSSFIFL